MGGVIAKRKNGTDWVQVFVSALNKAECIACGRCYKACPSGVMDLDSFEDDEGNDIKFMKLVNDDNCIGCMTCDKVCPKHCFTHG